jgi:IS4 transposase
VELLPLTKRRFNPMVQHDVNMMDAVPFEADSVYTMDRAYLDFERLYQINQLSACFVIKSKSNTRLRRVYSAPVDKAMGVQADQTVMLVGHKSRSAYPDPFRRVRYYDAKRNKRLVVLTNNFLIPAKTVADIYRLRWQVELFFKWIKQHLRIKSFFGTSPNAVKTQIWVAVCLSSRGDRQEAIESSWQSPHNFTDFGGQPL